jgi:DNA polymerase-3 subunit delta'
MGFSQIKGNKKAKQVLKNELKNKKESGTYLFFGNSKINLMAFAIGFAKALNCSEAEEDYCDTCRICKNIEKKVYSDLHIYNVEENFGINTVREIIYEAGNTSYEGRKKIFIIENVQAIRKEAANALLKTIEEPSKDTYFILLSKSLNLLPTIKSRSFLLDFYPASATDLEVDESLYDFFDGDGELIMYASQNKLDISIARNYNDIFESVKNYREENNVKDKIDIVCAIKSYIAKKKYMTEFEKIVYAEQLEKAIGKDKKMLKEVLGLFIINGKNLENTEQLLELKMSVIYNVNIANILYNFFTLL